MRVLLTIGVLAGVLAATTTLAKPAPMRMPPCLGPDTWDAIAKCMREEEPSTATPVNLSEHARALTDAKHTTGRVYVQELDGRWRNQRSYAPTMQVAGDAAVALGGAQVRRIEIREVTDLGNRMQLRMKSAVICGAPGVLECRILPYECAALANGRSVEIVRGELVVRDGVLQLVADRSRAGAMCNL